MEAQRENEEKIGFYLWPLSTKFVPKTPEKVAKFVSRSFSTITRGVWEEAKFSDKSAKLATLSVSSMKACCTPANQGQASQAEGGSLRNHCVKRINAVLLFQCCRRNGGF